MTKPKVFEKPTGVKDYLPHAVAKLRRIERDVLECMRQWGYEQIMTPTIEYYDTVGVASATSDQKLFKLLNQRGTTIVLRSDMTAPIARVVGSLLKDEPFPIRLSYHGNVFRAFEEEGGREAEFYQTGVELVGDASPEADAEVIALAIASLQAAGVPSFKIAMGHVGFLNGLFQETLPGLESEQEALKACLLQRDHVGYRDVIRKLSIDPAWQRELEDILRLRGGQEVCAQALELSGNAGARAAIRHLCEVWDVLEAYGLQEHVLIDLTMIGDFSYYTGMTFEGYASQLGFPVVSGGRYDNLLAQFGRPAAATGFGLKTTRILDVVEDEAEAMGAALVVYESSERAAAMAAAADMRAQGRAVVTALVAAEDKGQLQSRAQAGLIEDGSFIYNGREYKALNAFFGKGEQE
ncbi:ATP phosphoribosyltransferase regulatory subunit [Cohnella endophytica]|uniref:ATP phosphoribosyltransferase regulatory subunit n=1 Tax=Cohnella endophytica TaxID=2419778 RepID=A0A494XQJ5_9BACL|nr:ATP phosphoribosyltransferase regulatory subunit [Cohnella endophytica]RKP49793.1 ATP phosphoribosyltransferase regulatory subunit [Cohnella endophytica]